MKLDLFRTQWLDLVFEGRNKKYGAYELRKENPKTSVKALIAGGAIFVLAMSTPLLLDLLPDSADNKTLDEKVVLVDLEKPKEKLPEPIKPTG